MFERRVYFAALPRGPPAAVISVVVTSYHTGGLFRHQQGIAPKNTENRTMKTEKTLNESVNAVATGGQTFADAAMCGRVTDHVMQSFPLAKMSDIEGKEMILREMEHEEHMEYGESYRCAVSPADAPDECYLVFLRGTAILQKMKAIDKKKPKLPLLFSIFKPEGKRYWDLA